jgi:transcription factor MYB, plant
VKNYWNTKLSKKLRQRGIDPITHRPIAELMHSIGALAIGPPQQPNTSAYIPAPAAALPHVHDVAYHAAGLPQQQEVLVNADAPASPDHDDLQQIKWSDFLADDAAAEAQQVLGQQYHHEAVVTAGGGGSQAGGSIVFSGNAGAGGGDDGAAAFIDAILDCDKETGVDQLIAELLADPAYYAGSSSPLEMDWGGY